MRFSVQRLRQWRWWIFSIAILALVVVILATLIAVSEGWHTATADGIECQVAFQPLKPVNGYIEFFLQKQELIEPVFNGGYFINLIQDYGKNPLQLKVTTSGARGYGNATTTVNLVWDEPLQTLWMHDLQKIDFISQSGSHRNFPFDSANFNFMLTTDPVVNLPVIRFNNRVPGFYMPCKSVHVQRSANGTLQVQFELRRDRLTELAATMLFLAGVIFAFAITFTGEKMLPTAIASYFFSLWSIRGIFGIGPEGFPTLLDVGILTLCMLILVLLAIRILIRKFRVLKQPPIIPDPWE